MNKCKCGHTELAHGEDGKSCLAMLCLCEQFQPCEVEPEPTHRIKLTLVDCSIEYDNKSETGSTLWVENRKEIDGFEQGRRKQRDADEASANSQLQAIVKELEQELSDARKVNEGYRILNGELRLKNIVLEELVKELKQRAEDDRKAVVAPNVEGIAK